MGVGFGAALATAIATQPLPNGAEACGRLRRENAENATKCGGLRKATASRARIPALQNRAHQFNHGRGLHPSNQWLRPIISGSGRSSSVSRRRTSLRETAPAAREPGCRWRRTAADGGAGSGPRYRPPERARWPFSRHSAIARTQLHSSCSPGSGAHDLKTVLFRD